uniref:Peptidoglycan-recognition protein n=1 Tax=Samia ricini TaxID=63990 RepID=Q0KKW5_SAMRI|nr:peptidoglycan recognition protein A [Samia ricini]
MNMLLCFVYILFIVNFAKVNADCGIVSKDDWDGLTPVHVEYLNRPVKLVIIQHTDTPQCLTNDACAARVRSIQDYHMDTLKYWDIGSAFLIGGNAKVYEGSGWVHVSVPTHAYNRKALRITVIGNYNSHQPTAEQIDALKSLLRCGVNNGHLDSDYNVVGHRQLMATDSPGRKLYNIIRRWPEWLENVDSYKK